GEISLPLLRKDFLLHPIQVLEAKAYGGDVVLLIVRVLEDSLLKDLLDYSKELGLSHIVEVFDLREAERALSLGADTIGINNRDLDTLKVDLSLSERLTPKIKEMGAKFVIAESGIESRDQILRLENLGVDAFLVGTSLMKSEDPFKKIRELMGYDPSFG
ncbi:MAG: indole-3-glycerol-phosphate synthase, partial [Aquificaceae bacterium]